MIRENVKHSSNIAQKERTSEVRFVVRALHSRLVLRYRRDPLENVTELIRSAVAWGLLSGPRTVIFGRLEAVRSRDTFESSTRRNAYGRSDAERIEYPQAANLRDP
jgi:hypothetical protein